MQVQILIYQSIFRSYCFIKYHFILVTPADEYYIHTSCNSESRILRLVFQTNVRYNYMVINNQSIAGSKAPIHTSCKSESRIICLVFQTINFSKDVFQCKYTQSQDTLQRVKSRKSLLISQTLNLMIKLMKDDVMGVG